MTTKPTTEICKCGHRKIFHNGRDKSCSFCLKSEKSINGRKCPCKHFTPSQEDNHSQDNLKEFVRELKDKFDWAKCEEASGQGTSEIIEDLEYSFDELSKKYGVGE